MTAVTVETAGKRWCPFARSYRYDIGAPTAQPIVANRGPAALALDNHCLGEGCMAWRWADDGLDLLPAQMSNGIAAPPDKAAHGEGWECVRRDGVSMWVRQRPPAQRAGYCGLGGFPYHQK